MQNMGNVCRWKKGRRSTCDQQSWRSQCFRIPLRHYLHLHLFDCLLCPDAEYLSTSSLISNLYARTPPPILYSSKMGWLPWSSGESKKNEASDGGRIAPDRTSRARCWEGRDLFFACLDKNDILDGIKEDKKARQKCAKEVEEFEAACSQSWVRIEFLAWNLSFCFFFLLEFRLVACIAIYGLDLLTLGV